MKSPLIFCLLLLLPVFLLKSQNIEPKNSLSLRWGLGNLKRQDLIFSPFIHSDNSLLNVGLSYQRNAKFLQNVSLNFGSYAPSLIEPYQYQFYDETATTPPHSFTLVDIDYSLGQKIKETKNYRIFAGGAFDADIQAVNYAYGRLSFFGYNATLALGAFGGVEYQLNNKSKLGAALKLPLVSWLSRSPYLVNDDQFIENISSHSAIKTFASFIADGKLSSWSQIQQVDFNLDYHYRHSSRWGYGAHYHFGFLHIAQPRNLISFANTLHVSVAYNF